MQTEKDCAHRRKALIVLKYPYGIGRDGEQSAARTVLETLSQIEATAKGTEKLDTHVWLIDLENGLSFLAQIIALANARRVELQVLFVESCSNWITPKADPILPPPKNP